MALGHVIIGGGTGYIGSSILIALQNLNVKTTIISRMPGPKRITWVSSDGSKWISHSIIHVSCSILHNLLLNKERYPLVQDLEKFGLPEDATAVINVAGQNILDFKQRWSPGFKQNVWNSRVKTTQQLAKIIPHSMVNTFITISGVAYYPSDGKEYTEYDKCRKYDYLSELCHEWEKASNLPDGCDVRTVTIRSGVVLGRSGGIIKQIFLPFFLGLGGPIGDGTQNMPWIHVKDLVNLFIYALENKNISGILNGVAPQVSTNAEFTKAFARALNRPAYIPVPRFLLETLLGKERAKIMLEGQKVIPQRVLESNFKYQFNSIECACKEFAVLVYNAKSH